MIPRYTRPEMGRIWSDRNKFQQWLEVELAASEAARGAFRLFDRLVERTVQAQREFTGNVAHDLRTPLGAIGTSATFMP